MANFCTKCGTRLDIETGLCPQCDCEKINLLKFKPKFCTKCGTPLNAEGICPSCNPQITEIPIEAEPEIQEEIKQEIQQENTLSAVVVDETEEDSTEEKEAVDVTENVYTEDEGTQTTENEDSDTDVTETQQEEEQEHPVQDIKNTQNKIPNTQTPPTFIPTPPPVVNTPAPTVQPVVNQAPAVKQKKKKKVSVAEVLTTIFISFALFVTTLLAVGVISARNTMLSTKSMETLLESTNTSEIMNYMYEGAKSDISAYINEYLGTDLTDRDIDKYANKTDLQAKLATKFSTYFDDLLNNTDNFTLTKKEVTDFISDNKEQFEEISGVKLSDEQCSEIANEIVDEEYFESISPYTVRNNNKTVISIASSVLSKTTVVILIILVIVWILIMIGNNPSQAALGTGIVFILVGGLTTALAVTMGKFAITFGLQQNIATLCGNILYVNITVFASVLGSGVVLLIIRAIVRKIIEKAREKRALKNA
ncbi:MAG: zinc ribbon domain-containing protein [Ruminococcaceae bacterium]|nr:zinc ribbon domain-containing protein [Oscillospiraceae bacterium]